MFDMLGQVCIIRQGTTIMDNSLSINDFEPLSSVWTLFRLLISSHNTQDLPNVDNRHYGGNLRFSLQLLPMTCLVCDMGIWGTPLCD
jgi:hypothetical protein